jgi:hypothetical protein
MGEELCSVVRVNKRDALEDKRKLFKEIVDMYGVQDILYSN